MKRHRPPVNHPPRKLWLPSESPVEALGEPDTGGGLDASHSSEEDDLDKLLNQYEAQAAEDLQQTQPTHLQSGKQHAALRREAALQQPLAADNRGYKMLAAMGYQPGEGLGKSVVGRAEPIPLDLKQNRLGLGAVSKKAAAREALQLREREAEERMKHAQRDAEASIQAGRQRTAELYAARREQGQLRKAQQVCETLDTAAGVDFNHLWQPPPYDDEVAGAALSHVDRALPALLHGKGPAGAAQLAGRLGTADDDEVLEEAEFFRRDFRGPGQEEDEEAEERRYPWAAGEESVPKTKLAQRAQRDTHAAIPRTPHACTAERDELQQQGGVATTGEGWHQLPVHQRLEDVLRYLREQYNYCLYCGCQYDDTLDLEANCPGMFEADHD